MTEPVVATPPVVTPPVVTPPVVTPPAAVTPPVTPAPEATLLTPPPAPVGAPEKYELKLPENPALEATSLVEIEAFSKAQGLTQEKAQELVNFQNKWAADRATAEAAALEKQTKEWLAEIKSDKDFGGENLQKSSILSQRFVQRFGGEGFVKMINETGIGNNPELFRFVARAAAAMGEDSLVHGKAPGATQLAPGTDAAIAAAMFDATKK